MSRDFLPGELDELGERLKIEFGIDRLILTPPAIEERLLQRHAADRRASHKEYAQRQARRHQADPGQSSRTTPPF